MFTPVNQRRHTNVAVVRYKKGGHKFEIAAYPNKVLSWRSGVEKDLDEVMQTRNVFLKVAEGLAASRADLVDCFGYDDMDKIILEILEKGELQVAEKERGALLTQLTRDICNIVVAKCFNPLTRRPYPLPTIERSLESIHYTVRLNKTAKQQALEVARLLSKTMPLARVRMLLRVQGLTEKELKDLGAQVLAPGTPLPSSSMGSASAATGASVVEAVSGKQTCLVDPEIYRVIVQAAKSVEVLDNAVFDEGMKDEKEDADDKDKEKEKEQQEESKEKESASKGKGKSKGKTKHVEDKGKDEGEGEEESEGEVMDKKAEKRAKRKEKKKEKLVVAQQAAKKGKNHDSDDEEDAVFARKMAALRAASEDEEEEEEDQEEEEKQAAGRKPSQKASASRSLPKRVESSDVADNQENEEEEDQEEEEEKEKVDTMRPSKSKQKANQKRK
jgi:ribosome maturation protein SDO1